jgi:nucleotide-binding universal stress UspA family protein
VLRRGSKLRARKNPARLPDRAQLASFNFTGNLIRAIASRDLIVAGGYGHTRLGEWIFGGLTHDLMTNSPVCCLLSH